MVWWLFCIYLLWRESLRHVGSESAQQYAGETPLLSSSAALIVVVFSKNHISAALIGVV